MSITIWKISLNDFQKDVASLWKILNLQEKERANRFVFEKDKNRFVIARGLLRKILGQNLDQEPQSIMFGTGPFGKPHPLPVSLPPQGGGTRTGERRKEICFNLSHSGDLILIAVSNGKEIGVDVEKIKEIKERDDLVNRFFSDHEKDEFKKFPEDQKIKIFYLLWTKKEAFLKAKGVGLSGGLEKQNIKPNQDIQAINEVTNTGDQKVWTIQNLDCGEGYSGAVCVEGGECALQFSSYKNEKA